MILKQIVVLDNTRLPDVSLLQEYSQKKIRIYTSDPDSEKKIIQRIGDADCVLLSWRTSLSKKVLSHCKNLKLVCLCATNSNNIDLAECNRRRIIVSNVTDYGNTGVVEFILYELIHLVRGFGLYQWKDHPSELQGKTLGIIGLGTVGTILAQTALGFHMDVLYFSRTRKLQLEKKGLQYKSKRELLKKSDFISLHSPKNIQVLNTGDFNLMIKKILINTTLGEAFDIADFKSWIKKPNNYAIMDVSTSNRFYTEFHELNRVIFPKLVSGITGDALQRLFYKTVNNIKAFLEGKPINVIT